MKTAAVLKSKLALWFVTTLSALHSHPAGHEAHGSDQPRVGGGWLGEQDSGGQDLDGSGSGPEDSVSNVCPLLWTPDRRTVFPTCVPCCGPQTGGQCLQRVSPAVAPRPEDSVSNVCPLLWPPDRRTDTAGL
ncbi:unnamed protein product [Arctogadus glacialis]